MLKFNDLYVGYEKLDVLTGLSLTCKRGEITTVIGKNGCGKSTLLKSAVGILNPTRGLVELDGVPLSNLSDGERAKKIAYLSQGKNLPDVSVKRMVLHGRFPYLSYPRRYSESDYRIASEAMKRMDVEQFSSKRLEELSGGMRQKVYLAMALCQQADTILLDEPTTYLDVGQQLSLCKILRQLASEGKTIVTVLHDLIIALQISDKIAVISEGRVQICDTPEAVLKSGIITQLFGVKINRVLSEDKGRYYYVIGD